MSQSDSDSEPNVARALMEYVYSRDTCSICKKGGVNPKTDVFCFTSDGRTAHKKCFEILKIPIMKIDQYLREMYPKYEYTDCLNTLLMESFEKFKKQEKIKTIKSFFKNNDTDDFMIRFCHVLFMEIAAKQTLTSNDTK